MTFVFESTTCLCLSFDCSDIFRRSHFNQASLLLAVGRACVAWPLGRVHGAPRVWRSHLGHWAGRCLLSHFIGTYDDTPHPSSTLELDDTPAYFVKDTGRLSSP